jgi:hypothetical protein
MTPRDNKSFDYFFDNFKQLTVFGNEWPKTFKVTGSRNYLKFQEECKMNLNFQKEGEIMVNYGGRFGKDGKEYNMHYFSKDEMKVEDCCDT